MSYVMFPCGLLLNMSEAHPADHCSLRYCHGIRF